jgi:high affinity Mn2+ porin
MTPSLPPAQAGRRAVSACALLAFAVSGCALAPNLLSPSADNAVRYGAAVPNPAEPVAPAPAGPDIVPAGGLVEALGQIPPLTLVWFAEPASAAPSSQAGPRATGQEPTAPGKEKAPETPPPLVGPLEQAQQREPWYSVHEQGTIISQSHPFFRSPYAGPNSLLSDPRAATTETATLFAAARLWRDGPEVVFNPEIAGGNGLSGTHGVAGFPNGEATRVGVPQPTPYVARLFVRQTWNLDGPWEKLEDAPNQVAGRRDLNYLAVSVGKMSAEDVADDNKYSHDPRTQFMNWSLMYTGAWDYPANVRGYTYGVAVDFNTVFWAVHYGIFAEPAEANGAAFDPRFYKANGQILELEQHWGLGDHPGQLREWAFLNHAHMGKYADALAEMPVNPDITLTRAYRFKYGFGLNLEQELTRELGLFVRAGWNDGASESWAFTEIDRTLATGLLLKGSAWRRANDEVGLAGVINGLSGPHRSYLAAGGLGFILGDGRLNYAPEQIVEAYYNWQVVKGINVTLDVQGINHPGYNADRGPVVVGTLRVHFEH